MAIYREQGVILRTYKLGESDRIVTVLTQGRGKVRAVAKGVRKTKSKFGSRLEPTGHAALQFYEGRELDLITQAESLGSFRNIRNDLDRYTRAVMMLEAVDQIAQEHEANPKLYRMLVGGLEALEETNSPAVIAGFFWKLLALEGYRPQLDACVSCGETEDLVAFDIGEGGVTCRRCRQGVPITDDAITLIKAVLGGGLGTALKLRESETTRAVEHLATTALEHHLERRLRSAHTLRA